MTDPVIKKEESPEPLVMTMVPTMPSVVATTQAPVHISRSTGAAEDPMLLRSMPPPNGNAIHMPLAHAPYQGSSPRKYSLRARLDKISLPAPLVVLTRLPSLRTSTLATGRTNEAMSTTTIKTSTAQNTNLIKRLLDCDTNTERYRSCNMDEFELGGSDGIDGDSTSPVSPSLTDTNSSADTDESDEDEASPSQFEYEQLKSFAQSLHNECKFECPLTLYTTNVRVVLLQRDAIGRLFKISLYLLDHRGHLLERVSALENVGTPSHAIVSNHREQRSSEHHSTANFRLGASYRLETDNRSRSPSPSPLEYRQRDQHENRENTEAIKASEVAGNAEKTRFRKELQVAIPEKSTRLPTIGLPTPTTATSLNTSVSMDSATTPRTPFTPGRIGPGSAYKKTTTSILKRNNHNLDKSIPPANVQFPKLPLTDTEIIVYFYNSLSRPIVALRLYARSWGPASIVQALNDHREIDPPYLRNTCSVKCTTAIKAGRRRFGDDWEEGHRAVFADAPDDQATDLIRLAGDELHNPMDYEILALCANLKKHPEGEDAGVFTNCVKYCQEQHAAYTMSNVMQLAMDLMSGKTPTHPPQPTVATWSYPPGRLPNYQHESATKVSDKLAEASSFTQGASSSTNHHGRTNNDASTREARGKYADHTA